MTTLAEFLEALFTSGEIVFRAQSASSKKELPEVLKLLQRAYAVHALDVAGPRLALQPEIALAASELLCYACWFLVHHGEPADELSRRLTLPPPSSAADHLSADLLLRFLPHVQRRARTVCPSDPLASLLAQVLRQWPLSGILSDVAEEPITPCDFGGHAGLLLLYAERFAQNAKPDWLPSGPAREYVEMVYADLGKRMPERPVPALTSSQAESPLDDRV